MEIVMVSSEATPFAKTGGLADVVGTLPPMLSKFGHRTRIFLPAYTRIFHCGVEIEDTHVGFVLNMSGKSMAVRVLKAKSSTDNDAVEYYFIDQPHYFERPHLYGDQHAEYRDNCERFAFFNRAVVQAIDRLKIPVDIVHCHDWQSGLVPAYMRTRFEGYGWYDHAASVTTIHNLAYQGRYWVHDMHWTGLDWRYFTMERLEFHNDLCYLKSGITFSDLLTTVSPHYAKEIQTEKFGCGLDGVLLSRGDRLSGIVNGVDYEVWSPDVDPHLTARFNPSNWKENKLLCKADLQHELGLQVDAARPVVGLVGRLATQKGWDLIIPLMERWLSSENSVERDVQWAILGSGEHKYQLQLTQLAEQNPGRVGLKIDFSDPTAHKIEAGSDMFLMPSQYEPCGLNQLYSLRYGTVPVVHAVGGLVDTVVAANSASLTGTSATGFAFYHYDLDSLSDALTFAIDIFHREPQTWEQIVDKGMNQDWSWDKSARQYSEVYERARSMPRVFE